jgi:hypothetical protein
MTTRHLALILLVLVTIFLCSCAVKPTPIKGGEEIGPPSGWLEYCDRHPEDKGCIGMDKL